jgi:hypothetical protein
MKNVRPRIVRRKTRCKTKDLALISPESTGVFVHKPALTGKLGGSGGEL